MNDHGRDLRRSAGGRRHQPGRRFGTGAHIMLVLGMLLCFAVVLVVLGIPPALILTLAFGLGGLAGKLVYRTGRDEDDARDDGLDGDTGDRVGTDIVEPDRRDGVEARSSSNT